MKKLFLKSLALVAMLLCGLTASAKQYCAEEVTPTAGATENQTLVFTASKTGEMETTFTLTSTTSTFTGLYEAVFQISGGGVVSSTEPNYWKDWTLSGNTLTKVVTWTTYPTTAIQLHLVARRDNTQGGSDIIGYTFTDIDVSQTCSAGGGEKETFKPVMEEATLASVTYNSAVVNVAGTDKETENGEDVAVTRFKVVYGETTKTYTATDGKITITGLTAGTEYSFSIYAVDAAGNVSDNFASVKATTESRESQCSGERGHFGNPTVKRIAYTIAYDPTEKAVVYTISALNEKKLDFMEVHTTKGNYRVDIPTNAATTCTFTQKGLTEGEELGIRFLYSTDEIDGNEMTADQVSMSDPNIIYYKVGDCAMEIVEDTEAPVMGKATFASATYTSITLNVSAKDNVAVKRYHVVTTGVDMDILPANNQIVITGLTAGTTYTIKVTAKDAAGNESDNFATVEATTESLTYCDFATGHEGNANFGDANGRILLTLKQTAANKVQVTVKPNTENGATKLLDYLYVAPSGAKAPTYTAGAHIAEGGETSMSVEVEYEALPATMNFHLEWSHPAWDGNWATDVNGVTASMLCSEVTTAMPAVSTPAQHVQKCIENGTLIIYRDNKAYTVLGTAL